MLRFGVLLKFEIKKMLAKKKAILFLLALNVVPIIASILALLVFGKLKTWGLGGVEFSLLVKAIKALFAAHLKLFVWICPFFLALIVGDSFSGESGKGYLKTLLLTPVSRWQIIAAKSLALIIFLLLAVSFGAGFLQVDIWIARAISSSPNIIMDVKENSAIVDAISAFRLFAMMFVANLTLIGFFVFFSMFWDSPLLMALVSMIVLLSVHVYVLMAPFLAQFDPIYMTFEGWCFTRHLSNLFSMETINGILNKEFTLSHKVIFEPLLSAFGWAVFFFLSAWAIFERKQVLN